MAKHCRGVCLWLRKGGTIECKLLPPPQHTLFRSERGTPPHPPSAPVSTHTLNVGILSSDGSCCFTLYIVPLRHLGLHNVNNMRVQICRTYEDKRNNFWQYFASQRILKRVVFDKKVTYWFTIMCCQINKTILLRQITMVTDHKIKAKLSQGNTHSISDY